MVNGQPYMPDWAACFRHRGNAVSNLHCDVAPPLIEARSVVKHQDDDYDYDHDNRRCGQPRFAWVDKVRAFVRWKQLGAWKETLTETWHRFESLTETAHGRTTTGYQLEWTMAWHSAWVAHPHRATVGMQWLQNMVAQIFDGILEICKLCRFVAWTQVDQTCAGLAPTTKENWTNIYDLGLAITTVWLMAAFWGLVTHSTGHRLMAAVSEWFLYVYSEMIVH